MQTNISSFLPVSFPLTCGRAECGCENLKSEMFKTMKLVRTAIPILTTGLFSGVLRAQTTLPTESVFNLPADQPGRIAFSGSKTAELFTKEVDESFKGVLEHSYVSQQDGKFPIGFINASPAQQPWSGTMWTRDAGAFLRELVDWGYYEHARQTALCLMDFVGTSREGFIAFPRYFAPKNGRERGTEMDGHAAIIIAMVSLWQRLPAEDPFRRRLYEFLHQKNSPVRYIHYELENHPLIAGSGEFGGGDPKSLHDNVVQNNLCALALLSTANMEEQAGDRATADLWRKDADTIFQSMEKYLVDENGSWIWCIEPKTLKPDPAVVKKAVNVGFGGLNGVVCMSSDVLGLEPSDWQWRGAVVHGEKTFDELYSFPLRKAQFEKYGMWPQFNLIHDGLLTGPSYGQGYALQTMLLFDKLAMAGHALDFLAQSTFDAPGITFNPPRLSSYYFYERLYSPDAQGKGDLSVGCGSLNLVNVAEPLKVARLIVGVDDTSLREISIIPRLPPDWSGYSVENWPIRTSNGMVRADFSFERQNGTAVFHLQIKEGQSLPKLVVRMPAKDKSVLKRENNIKEVRFESAVAP